MTLAPLLAAPAVVQLHAFAALAAITLGLVQFAAPKGTLPHRGAGWAWALLMGTVAVSSFWITGVAGEGRFSWIHGLSGLTLVMVPLAVLAARHGQVRRHRTSMVLIFIAALLITGLFTLLPGRIMNRVVFG